MLTSTVAPLTDRRWPPAPSAQESDLVDQVLASQVWVDGAFTRLAESMLCEAVGADRAVAFNSCTSALHAVLAAYGVRHGATVSVPAFGFAGTVTGARHLGANFTWEDVGPDTLTADSVSDDAAAVLAVDTHGAPHSLNRVKHQRRPVVTDACQSLGSRTAEGPVGGSGTHVWSFSPTKLVAAPEGGAVTTDDEGLAEELRSLRDYGIASAVPRAVGSVVRPEGHNWRPTEISMAMVAHRLRTLPDLIDRAVSAVAALHAALDDAGLWRQRTAAGTFAAWHKVRFGVRGFDVAAIGRWERALAEQGIPTHRWGVLPLPQHPAFAGKPAFTPVAARVAAGTLCLGTESCPPMAWTGAEVDHVSDVILKIAESM